MEYSYFSSAKDYPFEYISVLVPDEYDKILQTFFGEWRVFKKGCSFHTGLVFDASIGYKDFKKTSK